MIRDSLAASHVTASRDATQYLVERLGGDRLLTRSELDKLALYAGAGGRVELEDALLVVGDTAALELDDAVMAAAEGDAVQARTRARPGLPGGGIPGCAWSARCCATCTGCTRSPHWCRPGLRSTRRCATPARRSFSSTRTCVKRQLGRLGEPALRTALDRIARAEIDMKTTGFPAETVCRQAMLAVALSARPTR